MKRRFFLKLAGATALSTPLIPGFVLGANDRIRVAIIGTGIRGIGLTEQTAGISGVEVAALCDPDPAHLEMAAAVLRKTAGDNRRFKMVADFRKILDDPEIDAVLIASPNHWHAHMTVMACQAGKDVMVEKPVCHTMWEGWRMIEVARKTGRIVAGGFQGRADSGLLDFFKWVNSENRPLGELKQLHALWYHPREPVEKRQTPMPRPENIDYDLWLGPASDEAILRKNLHYDWHWVWNTGNGEMGNLGAHYMDAARWALGDPKDKPVRVLSAGNRFVWDDAGETPNMHWASVDFGTGVPVVLEVCDLPLRPGAKRGNGFKGIGTGIIATYEQGEFRGGRGGGKLYDPENKLIQKFPGDSGKDHLPGFFRAIRNRKTSDLHSNLEDAVYSTQCCHLAQIAVRIGKAAGPDEVGRVVAGQSPVLHKLWEHISSHLDNWNVDYSKEPWMLGPELAYDWAARDFADPTPPEAASRARDLHQREYRKAFPFPES